MPSPGELFDLGTDVGMYQTEAARQVGHGVAQHTGRDMRCDDDSVWVPFGQPAQRQSAATQTEPVTALRHPNAPRTFRTAPSTPKAGELRTRRRVRSSMMSHSVRAWPAGATTASVACRN